MLHSLHLYSPVTMKDASQNENKLSTLDVQILLLMSFYFSRSFFTPWNPPPPHSLLLHHI